MGPILALLIKELREHSLVLLLLTFGFVGTVVMGLLSNQAATFSLTPLEVVRFELLWIVPLIAFILGNLLVVREFLNRTRLFVEALPLRSGTLFTFKYLFGFFFLALLMVLCVAITVYAARSSDVIDTRFVGLILAKSLALVAMIWSVVFCLSFCGKLRLALYFLFIGLVLLVVFSPGIDHLRLGPMALLDANLFAFERYEIPWQDLAETLGLAFLFVVAAWLLVSVNEGSVAEMLSKPLSRRDYVALGILALGALTMLGTLAEKWQPQPDTFGGDSVVSSLDPPVSVLYVDDYRAEAQAMHAALVQAVDAMQVELGIATIPQIRISLDPRREVDNIDYRGVGGVLVTANFVGIDAYQSASLRSVVLHQVIQVVTQRRAQVEPWHWLLDGVSRWLAEQKVAQPVAANESELLARAVHVERQLQLTDDLSRHWQVLAEQHGYAAAEALAYSMILFLVETLGEEVLRELAQSHLAVRSGTSSLVSLRALQRSFAKRFAELTNQQWTLFHRNWRRWLQDQGLNPDIAARLNRLPALEGFVELRDIDSAPVLEAGYRLAGDQVEIPEGECVLRHLRLIPFDVEVELGSAERLRATCQLDTVVHRVVGRYGFGERVLVVLEFDTDAFHEPIRVHAQRIDIK